MITGYGVVTPIGYSVAEMMQGLDAGTCATQTMPPQLESIWQNCNAKSVRPSSYAIPKQSRAPSAAR